MMATTIQVAAFLAALGTIWALVVRPMWRTHKQVMQAVEAINLISMELGRNGGASLRDALDRVEIMVAFQDRRARALLQDAAHGYAEGDPEGQVTFVNRTLLRWADRTADEVHGEGWVNCIHAEDKERLQHEWASTVTAQRDLSTAYRVVSPSGEATPVRAHSYVIKAQGTLLGWAAILHKE